MTPELMSANFSSYVFDKSGATRDLIKIAKIPEDEFCCVFNETQRSLTQNTTEILVLTADGVLGWVLATNGVYNRFTQWG